MVSERRAAKCRILCMVPEEQTVRLRPRCKRSQQPYKFQVCVMKPETRTRQFQVCRMVSEQQEPRSAVHGEWCRKSSSTQATEMQYVAAAVQVPGVRHEAGNADAAVPGLPHGRRAAEPRSRRTRVMVPQEQYQVTQMQPVRAAVLLPGVRHEA